jgi:uncharacterized membrane protein
MTSTLPVIQFNKTQFIFTAALLAALASIVLPFALGCVALLATLASMAFSIWAIHKSDTTGFIKTSQIRRAFESARHFNIGQVILLFGLLLVQVLVVAYVMIQPPTV